MKIAINGAGIAGPALAYWLLHFGHEPVLVEQAPAIRTGGYITDFWGVGYDLAERMELIPRIRACGYQVEEVRFLDAEGGRSGGFSTALFGRLTHDRFTSVRRSDIAAALYDSLEGRVETLFGDSIAAIEKHPEGVTVSFDHHAPRNFDLVVGADGLHSRVRSLVFGPESETYLGYKVAAFEVAGYRPKDELVYVSHTQPGKQISRFAMRDDLTLFLFVFRDPSPDLPPTEDARKQALRDVFGDMAWETPQILAAMDRCDSLYFDRVSQIRMNRWSKGRIALVGDAAACVSLLAGEGIGLAMAEAYVLAGELNGGDYEKAFSRYQALLHPFIAKKQRAAEQFASFFAPATRLGLAVRGLSVKLMNIPFLADLMIGGMVRDDITLPMYTRRA